MSTQHPDSGGSTATRQPAKKKKRRRRPERNAAHYDADTVEFIKAVDSYRRRFDKAFPNWSEVLDILKSLGYSKVDSQAQEPQPVVEPLEPQEPLDEAP